MKAKSGMISAVAAALLLCSCENGDRSIQTQGARGVFDGNSTVVRGKNGEKLKVHRPGSMKLRRGEAESVDVRLERENFSEPVKISLSHLPTGVEAVDAPRTTDLEHVEIVLAASTSADLVANHQVMLTVEGPDGMSATETFDLTVRDK